MSGRNWCYTLNNPTEDEISAVDLIACRYNVYGYEIGEEGTEHLQGYIEFDKVMRLSACKKLITRAHFEPRKGTREQAIAYCKKDGMFFEYGQEQLEMGKRNDLINMRERIKNGARPIDLVEEMPETVAKNLKFMDRALELYEKECTKKFRKLEVHVLWGDAGSGKTRRVWEQCPNVFTVNAGENFPFNGYDGETEILLDDFYGGIKYHELLRILDGYQYRVNVKGGHRYAKWTKVFITSNKPPESWYEVGLTPALQRRLTTVTVTEVRGNTEGPEPVLQNLGDI